MSGFAPLTPRSSVGSGRIPADLGMTKQRLQKTPHLPTPRGYDSIPLLSRKVTLEELTQ
jgi:hypothetical protein